MKKNNTINYKILFSLMIISFLCSALVFYFIVGKDYFDNLFNLDQNQKQTEIIQTPTIEKEVPKIHEVIPECMPENVGLEWDNYIITKNNISFPYPEEYSVLEGVTTFRSNNFRNTASYGFSDVEEEKLSIKWRKGIGYLGEWTGVGWNGQPAIVKWSDELKLRMNINMEKIIKENLKEVIYATLDGKIYFLDLDDGKETRKPIDIENSMKCTVTVDPRGYPLLYCGQGIKRKGNIEYRIFNLFDQSVLYSINGEDEFAYRDWSAFDSSSLVSAKDDSLVVYGENGLVYALKLNTSIDSEKRSISINPVVSKFRYKSPVDGWLGIEGSVTGYKNYAYFVDNSGTLMCFNLNKMEPRWVRNVTDDSDSTIALDIENNGDLVLYTACEVDKQKEKPTYSYIRKINAMSGELLWEKRYNCLYNSNTNGGVLGSPIIGKDDIKDYVIYSIAKVGDNNNDKLIAFNKDTGETIWKLDFDFYSWSSPVDIHTKDGKTYIIFCDGGGRMYLIEAKTGKILDKIELGTNVEGSPAVYENIAVIGTRGQEIIGVEIN